MHNIWHTRTIYLYPTLCHSYLNSKVHGANMGPIWGRQDPGGPHVGPMLSGYTFGGNELSCIPLSWICDIQCNVLEMYTGICTWHSDNRNHFKYMYCFHLTHSGDESMDSGFAGSRVFSTLLCLSKFHIFADIVGNICCHFTNISFRFGMSHKYNF